MCGKAPTDLKTGYSIGPADSWRGEIRKTVWPWKDVDINVQSPDISYRMDHPEVQKEYEKTMRRFEEGRKETVNHPDHYNSRGIEVMDVIRAFDLSFSLGNVVKYVTRAGKKHKETYLEDLKKAKWYLDDEIRHVEGIPQGILEENP